MLRHWRRAVVLLWLAVALLLNTKACGDAASSSGDLPIHYHLLRAYLAAFEDGDWWPRWAGILDGGRGNPVFTFYGPLFYAPLALAKRLLGLHALTALKGAMVGVVFLGEVTAFALARRFFSRGVSVVAGILFVASPAFLHLSVWHAFLPNSLAMALVPLVLLHSHRLLTEDACGVGPRLRRMMPFALAYGAIVLVHPITTLLTAVALVFWTLCWRRHITRSGLTDQALGLLLVVLLTAFFWIPQVTELHWIQHGLGATLYDYREQFLFANGSAQTPYRLAWSQGNQIASISTVAETVFVVALLGAMAWARGAGQRRALCWFSAVTLVFGLFISLPISSWCWAALPGLRFIQFPWRFQPYVALSAALVAGAMLESWVRQTDRWRGTSFALVLLSFSASGYVSYLLARPWEESMSHRQAIAKLDGVGLQPMGLEAWERVRGEAALFAANQFVFRPRDVGTMLYPPVNEVGGAQIVEGHGQLLSQELRNHRRTFSLGNEQPVRVRVLTYDYPHWKASIDGQPAPIVREPRSGLMLVDVPAGRHTLDLRYDTAGSGQTLSVVLSCLGLALVLAGLPGIGANLGAKLTYLGYRTT